MSEFLGVVGDEAGLFAAFDASTKPDRGVGARTEIDVTVGRGSRNGGHGGVGSGTSSPGGTSGFGNRHTGTGCFSNLSCGASTSGNVGGCRRGRINGYWLILL